MSDRNGCYNRRPFVNDLWVQDGSLLTTQGSLVTRIPVMKKISFVMSRECKHDKKATDPKCQGCRWQSE